MINLPETVDELIKDHRVEKRHVQKYNFEAFHDSVVSEDHRVASLALVPLVETRAEAPRTLSGKVTRSQGVLSASIKVGCYRYCRCGTAAKGDGADRDVDDRGDAERGV